MTDSGLLKDLPDMFLGLTDPFAHHLRDVDPLERPVELTGDDLGA